MKWITMCSVVACLILMTIFFFPDAERIFTLGVNKFRGRDEDTLFNLGGLPFPLQPVRCAACIQPGLRDVFQLR